MKLIADFDEKTQELTVTKVINKQQTSVVEKVKVKKPKKKK